MKTGFKDLDSIIKLNRGELTVVASRPAMGKSTFVQNVLSNVALKDNETVLFYSLEESKEKIINRLIIRNSMIEADKFELYNEYKKNKQSKPNLSDEELDRIVYGVNLLKGAPIYIASDTPYTIDDIRIKSRELKLKKDIKLIIIDYLQLIQFDKKELLSRDNEITEILKKLKILAKELDVPIIVTSQLSQKCEKREDKKPYIADFSNSEKGILTHSDKILFLYRNSYYYKKDKNTFTDVIVAKNNDGGINTIKLAWLPEYYMFGNATAFKKKES